jgi:hypothetical protein
MTLPTEKWILDEGIRRARAHRDAVKSADRFEAQS